MPDDGLLAASRPRAIQSPELSLRHGYAMKRPLKGLGNRIRPRWAGDVRYPNSDREARVDVVIAAHSGNLEYGGERSLLELARHLTSQGIKAHVVLSHQGTFAASLEQERIPFTVVWMPWWVRSPEDSSPFRFRRADPRRNVIVELVDLIRSVEPKLCFTNTITMPWLAYAAAITGTRHVWFVRESGVSDFGLDFAIGVEDTRRSISVLSDGVFFNSETTAKEYAAEISRSKVKGVIYPVGGVEMFPEPVDDPFSAGSFRILMVGRIQAYKGQMEAVRAVELVRESGVKVELVLMGGVGELSYARLVSDYVESHHLQECVRLVGFQNNPASYLALADVALTCARNEAFGRTTVEAMLMGKPVIGVNSGGTAEIIDDGVTGLLYEPGDVSGLAAHILLLQGNPEIRAEMGHRAASEAGDRFAGAAVYEPFMAYFRSIGQQPNSGLDLSPLMALVEDHKLVTSPGSMARHFVEVLRRRMRALPSPWLS